jgi:hypothetical protein
MRLNATISVLFIPVQNSSFKTVYAPKATYTHVYGECTTRSRNLFTCMHPANLSRERVHLLINGHGEER